MNKPRIKYTNPMRQYIADPSAMGLFAFASITFMAAAINCKWLTSDADAMFAPAVFYGGLVQVIAGILDLLRGETVGGSTFVAFGMYWVSHGFLGWPSFAATRAASGYKEAVGWYLLTWACISFASFLGFLTVSGAHIVLLGLVTTDFTLLAIGHLADSPKLLQGTGYILLITALLAYYLGVALLLRSKGMKLPIWDLQNRDAEENETHLVPTKSASRSIDQSAV